MEENDTMNASILDTGQGDGRVFDDKFAEEANSKKKKYQKGLFPFLNCCKEVVFILILFIVLGSQLDTKRALEMRQEVAYRFDLLPLDYDLQNAAKFNSISTFEGFFNWVNTSLLPNIYIDDFYQSMKHNNTDWNATFQPYFSGPYLPDLPPPPNTAGRILLENLESPAEENRVLWKSDLEEAETEHKKLYPESCLGKLVEGLKENIEGLKREQSEKKRKDDCEGCGSVSPDFEQRSNQIQENLEQVLGQDRENRQEILKRKTAYAQPRRNDEFFQKRFPKNFDRWQSRNGFEEWLENRRGLQGSEAPVQIEGTSEKFYYPQFIGSTKPPITFNKIITTLRFRSSKRLRSAVGPMLPDVLTEVVDTGITKEFPLPYNELQGTPGVTTGGYLYDMNIYGKNLTHAQNELFRAVNAGILNNR